MTERAAPSVAIPRVTDRQPPRASRVHRSAMSASEQSGNSWRYLYQRLSEKEFQQLCGALLRLNNPGIRCYPVGMRDGGKDIEAQPGAPTTIYQVKWTSKVERDPVTWLKRAIEGERTNIERLIAEEGATNYILMTSVAGTSVPKTGTIAKLDKELAVFSEKLGIPMTCLWQSDVDSMVDSAPDATKWSYANMLAGHDLIRFLIYGAQIEGRAAQMRATLLKVMATQWGEDAKVKFSQVEMEQLNIVDLFIDVEEDLESAPRNALDASAFDRRARGQGTVQYLLRSPMPLTLVRGEPGQGKSTLAQYLCQVHRAAILPAENIINGSPPEHTTEDPKLVFRTDLRDYATWLGGRDPFGEEEPTSRPKRRRGAEGSLDRYLAHYCNFYSGGRSVSVEQIQDVLDRYPVLIVLDGLDEVAEPVVRLQIVEEINRLARRMGSVERRRFQLVVTTRPNATGLPEPSADMFEMLHLRPLSVELQSAYVRKWADLNNVQRAKRRQLTRVFLGTSAQEHIAQLAVNPMQLTILLYLVNRWGESIPTARTPLYTSYMETLLGREVDNRQIAREHIPYVEETTAYLGWRMQSGVETNPDAGRMSIKAIKRALLIYLDEVEGPKELVDKLFAAVSDRFWALSSKSEGTFEFAVQPVREYFAARFLAQYAGSGGQAALKQDVLRELMDSAYWLNTARFYAGFANPNELAGLVYGLREGLEAGRHPLQARVTAWSLLDDGIFSAATKVQRDVARLLSDDLSVRLLRRRSQDGISFDTLPAQRGGSELAAALMACIEANPEHPLARERAGLLRRLGMDRDRLNSWWLPVIERALGSEKEAVWLSLGAETELVRLTPTITGRLTLRSAQGCQAALAVGAAPAANTTQAALLLGSVLDGQCSDVTTSSPIQAGSLLRAVRPQRFISLALDSAENPIFPSAVGHYEETAMDRRNRSSVFDRLVRLDARYQRLRRVAAFRSGEKGTTAPWQNTAREIASIHRPCWLAAEIALIGAATQDTHTGGNISKNGLPGGPAVDYVTFVGQARSHRASQAWWNQLFADYSDVLTRRMWALGLVSMADESVVLKSLQPLDETLNELDDETFQATADSSSRLGASSVARRLSASVLAKATERSTRCLLLLAQHFAELGRLDPLDQVPVDKLLAMLHWGAASWPALRGISARMLANPSEALLNGLRAAGSSAVVDIPSDAASPGPGYLAAILQRPGDYPHDWVTAAERWHSQSNRDSAMAITASSKGWVPLL
jgi:hypothetical protein